MAMAKAARIVMQVVMCCPAPYWAALHIFATLLIYICGVIVRGHLGWKHMSRKVSDKEKA